MFGRLALYCHLLQASKAENAMSRTGRKRRSTAQTRSSPEVGMLLRLACVITPVLAAVAIVQWVAH